jgi:hypothetical protein
VLTLIPGGSIESLRFLQVRRLAHDILARDVAGLSRTA